jgi:hypothetical protein
LRCSEHDIKAPVIEPDLLAANTAHTIYNKQCVGADTMDELRKGLELAQHTCGGVDMCDSQDLVFAFLQCLLNLIELWPVANFGFQLRDLDTICLKAVGERVGKVSGVED